jgi:hypothetical protein
MSEKKEFNLPGSGYDVITKILHAYIVCGDGKTALGEVASKSGLDKTMVSRNNAFLVSLGVLDGGRDKALTGQGKALAMAIGNSIVEDIRRGWRDILLACPATKAVVDMIKIQKGVAKNEMPGRVASTLGIVAAKASKTGINTLIELFEKGELLELSDGKYKVIQESLQNEEHETNQTPESNATQSNNSGAAQALQTATPPLISTSGNMNPSVHIDLQIHISPESTPEQIEKIFESIAKHLYKSK